MICFKPAFQVLQFFCPNKKATLGIIVVNMILSFILLVKRINDLPCTIYHCKSLIVFIDDTSLTLGAGRKANGIVQFNIR